MLAGCAGTSTQTIDLPSAEVARAFKPIPNDCTARPQTQAAIAEHNSVHATLTTGTPTVYRPKTAKECARERLS